MEVTLSLTTMQHSFLQQHLFPGDDLEAAAILLCGHRAGKSRHRLIVHSVNPIPYDKCSVRTPYELTWDVEYIVPLLELAEQNNWTIIKVHSHPGGYEHFSDVDDGGDQRFIPAIQSWVEKNVYHGSVIMLPSGRMFGRYLTMQGDFCPYDKIGLVGDDIVYWTSEDMNSSDEFAASHRQLFGEETFSRLRSLTIAVVGCSGTGSPVIEQLTRLGVGELVLVDDDVVEIRNLNRILNTRLSDAAAKHPKTDVLSDAVTRIGLGTKVQSIDLNLWSPEAIRSVAECDVIFGCMDTVDGRYLLNSLATYYCIPYFDLGVRIVANNSDENYGDIIEICGSVHYLKPGHSLMSRQVFTMSDVSAAGLARTDPGAYKRDLQDGYIRGIPVHRPAVISLNMTVAGLAVNELLARLHPFREALNQHYDHIEVSLLSMEMFAATKPEPCPILSPKIGLGDREPLLDLPELSSKVYSNGHH
ncbi:MAG: ThiF family adenylyltransferase [Chloroflexi bacterium]|nr:ThiF family adenylyltransferase [Chloroflexota bacterium]